MFKALTQIASLIIAVAIVLFVVKPLFEDIQVIQQETAEYNEAIAHAAEFNALLSGLVAKRDGLSASDLERLDALVPNEIDEIKRVVDLESMARRHGLVFSNVGVQLLEASFSQDQAGENVVAEEGITAADFESADIQFTVFGTYDQMRRLLDDIERSLVLSEIIGLSFEVVEGNTQQYQITVRVFALKPEGETL